MKTIPNVHPNFRTLVRLTTPYAHACPASGEPQAGSLITLVYVARGHLIELHAIQEYLRHFSEDDRPIDLETVAQCTARDVGAALGVPVLLIADYLLRDGLRMRCVCRA